MRLTVGLWSFVSPIWKDTPSLLFLWDCPPNLPPQVQLHSTIQGIPGPAEFWANTRRHDLSRSPDCRGRWDPLPGMDACIQPNGRPPSPFSSAELEGKRGQKITLLSGVSHLSSPLLFPPHPYSFKPFKTIQRPNVPEGTIHLSGFSRSGSLISWLAGPNCSTTAPGSLNHSKVGSKWEGETIAIVNYNASVIRDHILSLKWTSLVTQMVKHLPTMRETQVQSLGWIDPLEKEIATHSSILAWKIPWMEEPGRLQSMGSQRVGHDWATSLSLYVSWMTSNGISTERDTKVHEPACSSWRHKWNKF